MSFSSGFISALLIVVIICGALYILIEYTSQKINNKINSALLDALRDDVITLEQEKKIERYIKRSYLEFFTRATKELEEFESKKNDE